MKFCKLSLIVLFTFSFSETTYANNFITQNEAVLIEQLHNLCNEDTSNKLRIVDLLMEQIARDGMTSDKKIKHDINPNLYNAGARVLILVKRIYTNKDNNTLCQRDLNYIVQNLQKSISNKNSEEDLLTSKE